jgi:DNA mismatch repair protein MutS2
VVHFFPMNEKTLKLLEYEKIRGELAKFASFEGSRKLVESLNPSMDFDKAQALLAETNEARNLIDLYPQTTVGAVQDIRSEVTAASRGVVMSKDVILSLKTTLISARQIQRQIEKTEEDFPILLEKIQLFPPATGLVDKITRILSDQGEVLDSASPRLGSLRSELKVSYDRLMTKLQKILHSKNVVPHLQDSIITQRDGRFVIPLRAESKGSVKSVIHDVSSSGATVFVEPLQAVELNNKYRESQLAIIDEERRILAELSDEIGSFAFEINLSIKLLAEIDVILAKAKYAISLNATAPTLVERKGKKSPGLNLSLWQARHPLLAQDEVVPIDVVIDNETKILLITGPNTGGKTVSLKTVGLLVCMAQAGMQIPVQAGSTLQHFTSIFADIGDEQSIEQSLSTFSGHIVNIIDIFEQINDQSLVILDELGAGTDPQEGAALARAMLSYLIERNVPSVIATHYPELKEYAHGTDGIINASMEFDIESLRPTYHLTIGIPGQSNALLIAKRLGLQDEIIDNARKAIDPNELRNEDYIQEIFRQRESTRKAQENAQSAQDDAEKFRDRLAVKLREIEKDKEKILAEAKKERRAEINKFKKEVRQIKRQIEIRKAAEETLEVIESKADDLAAQLGWTEQTIDKKFVAPAVAQQRFKVGDKVILTTIQQEAVIRSLSKDDAEIQIGNLRMRAPLYNLDKLNKKGEVVIPQAENPKPAVQAKKTPDVIIDSPGVELSLRGLRVDEAIDAFERYLDRAFISGLPYSRIVHGKGTGKLRAAIREEAKKHPYILRFESGGEKEGGDGVTMIFYRR